MICKSCGKDSTTIMCEDCQKESHFTVSGKELTKHIEEQQRRSDANYNRLVEENKKQQEYIDKRVYTDELHRLYTMFINREIATTNEQMENAMKWAKLARDYFEEHK